MKRGSTPVHEYTLPFDAESIEELEITYAQGGMTVLQKHLRDAQVNGNVITVRLTQEETFLFRDDETVEIQIRVKTAAGEVLPSNIMRTSAERCLSDEVL